MRMLIRLLFVDLDAEKALLQAGMEQLQRSVMPEPPAPKCDDGDGQYNEREERRARRREWKNRNRAFENRMRRRG